MLDLQSISVFQFKNYSKRSFIFNNRIIGICGNNGSGKTNLLDAIYYLCFTKSYFSRIDAINVQRGQSGFRLEGEFIFEGKKEKAVCIFRETGKKEFYLNEGMYERLSGHIGRYTCVMIAPDDAQLITGGSEERRKFLDTLLSQLDAEYLQQLISYNRILRQRNSLLASFGGSGFTDLSLLEVLNEQLLGPAACIFEKRKHFLSSFIGGVVRLYEEIAQNNDDLVISYASDLLSDSFEELLKVYQPKDLAAQRTTTGIHRDEIEIQMNGQQFKNIASQGQRKSLLFALKLAAFDVLRDEKGYAPILLLDDVFEKLDEQRISNLLRRVCLENKGQVFITDTNQERLAQHLELLKTDYQLINLYGDNHP